MKHVGLIINRWFMDYNIWCISGQHCQLLPDTGSRFIIYTRISEDAMENFQIVAVNAGNAEKLSNDAIISPRKFK